MEKDGEKNTRIICYCCIRTIWVVAPSTVAKKNGKHISKYSFEIEKKCLH